MSRLGVLLGSKKDAVWRQLAERVEGRFIEGGFLIPDVVQARSGDWILTLDTYTDEDTTYTRLRAPYVNPEGFAFTIYRSGFFTGLSKLFGLRDIEVGYPRFDRQYVIHGNSEQRVRKFFDNDRIRELIDRQPRIHLQVRDGQRWFKAKFPDGVDELRFRCKGVLQDLDQLESLFELFTEFLHQLCHDGKAHQDDVDIHIWRLSGPGGEIRRKHLLWEGDPRRRAAAVALGRLKDPKAVGTLASVLRSGDIMLRANAIDALASIGDPKAIRPLVRLLGDTNQVGGTRMQDRVARALRRLGEGDLADDVLAALEGDASHLRDGLGEYRGQVIEAFVMALDGPAGAHAAKGLEELHAIEALPRMREVLRRTSTRRDFLRDSSQVATGTGSPTAQAIEAAIRELEARAALPRSAEAHEVVVDTLPRVALDPETATDMASRAAEVGEMEHRKGETGHRKGETGHRKGETGHRKGETGHGKVETGHGRVETGHRKGETGHGKVGGTGRGKSEREQ